jgi:hypothetical protein
MFGLLSPEPLVVEQQPIYSGPGEADDFMKSFTLRPMNEAAVKHKLACNPNRC